jgi:hypothetical protein
MPTDSPVETGIMVRHGLFLLSFVAPDQRKRFVVIDPIRIELQHLVSCFSILP